MISVVIPTFNRCKNLDRCLEALYNQTLSADYFEVLVVDDGSIDETAESLQTWHSRWPRLRFFRQENAGPAAARNLGIRNARSHVVAFTDDDCLPAPNWLEEIYRRFEAGLSGCLHGPVRSSLPSSTFVHSVIADGALITANAALEKTVLDQLGAFDTRFSAPWCEDADLYYRLMENNIPITYDRQMVVQHPPRYQTFWTFLRKTRFFQFYGLIAQKHPDREPLRRQNPRLSLAVRKMIVLGISALFWTIMLKFPIPLGIVVSPAAFWVVDWWRLAKMKKALAAHSIQVRWKDQFLFIFLNWAVNLLEGYYLLKGRFLHNEMARD